MTEKQLPSAGSQKDRAEAVAEPRAGDKTEQAGAEVEDLTRTPGDGTLTGTTPAGLTVEELLRRANEDAGPNQTGTG